MIRKVLIPKQLKLTRKVLIEFGLSYSDFGNLFEVVEQLMINLFDPQYAQGVVVDGFVSITCARVVPFMFKYFHEIHELSSTSIEKNPTPPVFKFCVLYVNEDNSVRRQLVNHKKEESAKKFDAEGNLIHTKDCFVFFQIEGWWDPTA